MPSKIVEMAQSVNFLDGQVNRNWELVGSNGERHLLTLFHDCVTGARAAMLDYEVSRAFGNGRLILIESALCRSTMHYNAFPSGGGVTYWYNSMGSMFCPHTGVKCSVGHAVTGLIVARVSRVALQTTRNSIRKYRGHSYSNSNVRLPYRSQNLLIVLSENQRVLLFVVLIGEGSWRHSRMPCFHPNTRIRVAVHGAAYHPVGNAVTLHTHKTSKPDSRTLTAIEKRQFSDKAMLCVNLLAPAHGGFARSQEVPGSAGTTNLFNLVAGRVTIPFSMKDAAAGDSGRLSILR